MQGHEIQQLHDLPTSPVLGYIDPPSDEDRVDNHSKIVFYIMPPSNELSWMGYPPRTVCMADPDLIFTTHAKFNYINVDEPGSVSSTEWPPSGITLWFLREPSDPQLSHKEKHYRSKSMVRFLSRSRAEGMELPALMQILPLHHQYKQCSMEKAFQVLTGNPKISVLPSLQPLHRGRFSVILSSSQYRIDSWLERCEARVVAGIVLALVQRVKSDVSSCARSLVHLSHHS